MMTTFIPSPGPLTYIDEAPFVRQEMRYSCGAKSVRIYQAGKLVDVEWLIPIRRVKPTDVIEHREVELLNHHYLNK